MSLEELIRACAETGDDAAWEEFVNRFHELIAATVIRTARRWGSDNPALIDDLIQETYLKLCSERKRLLSEFTPQHPESFYGFLKVVTANVVNDHFRSLHAHKRGLGQPHVSIDEPGTLAPIAKAGSAECIQREILLKEVDEALCAVLSGDEQVRDRTIFWLYHRHGFTAEEIAQMPSISLTVKGVESVLYRLKRAVEERLAEGRGIVGQNLW